MTATIAHKETSQSIDFSELLRPQQRNGTERPDISQLAEKAMADVREGNTFVTHGKVMMGVLETLDMPLVVLSPKGDILLWNDKAKEILQIESGRYAHPEKWREYIDLCREDGHSIPYDMWPPYQTLCDQTPHVRSCWLHTPLGKRYIELHSRPIFDDRHQMEAVVLTWRLQPHDDRETQQG